MADPNVWISWYTFAYEFTSSQMNNKLMRRLALLWNKLNYQEMMSTWTTKIYFPPNKSDESYKQTKNLVYIADIITVFSLFLKNNLKLKKESKFKKNKNKKNPQKTINKNQNK